MNLQVLSLLLALVSGISTLQSSNRSNVNVLRSYQDLVFPRENGIPIKARAEPVSGADDGGSSQSTTSDGGDQEPTEGNGSGGGSGSGGGGSSAGDGTTDGAYAIIPNDDSNPLQLPQPDFNAAGISGDLTPKEGSTTTDDDAQFEIGTYQEDSLALFGNFDDAQRLYHSKIADFFIGQDPEFYQSLSPYAKATGSQQPFPNDDRPSGQPLTYVRAVTAPTTTTYASVFDPAQPTALCGAWTSLASYCGGTQTKCICYSGAYFVPEQWNSLAAACAAYTLSNSCDSPSSSDFWCSMASTASSYQTLCPTSGGADSSDMAVRFAATFNAAAATSTNTGMKGAAHRVGAGSRLWLAVILLCYLIHI